MEDSAAKGQPNEAKATPTIEQLWHGVILGTIIRAVFNVTSEHYDDSYMWRGNTLWMTDYSEVRGAITFTPDRVVGVFFNAESERSPFGEDTIPPYDAEIYFAAAPPDVLPLARRTVLPELINWLGDPKIIDEAIALETTDQLDEDLFVPVITAAFWSEGKRLTAGEPWSKFIFHGGYILEGALLGGEAGLVYLAEGWALQPEQVTLARQLFTRRLATDDLPMLLTTEEYARLTVDGRNQLTSVQQLLSAVGISLP